MEQQLIGVSSDIAEIKGSIKDLSNSLRNYTENTVTHAHLNEKLAEQKSEIDALKKYRVVQNALSGILGSILTLLTGFFIANIGG